MRARRTALLLKVTGLVAAIALAGPASASAANTYNLTISSQPTTSGDITCASGDCYPTAAGANLNVAALATDLDEGAVTIGNTTGNDLTGTITIEGSISGSSALTFQSEGDVVIDDTTDSGDTATLDTGLLEFYEPVSGPSSGSSSLTIGSNGVVFLDGTDSTDPLYNLSVPSGTVQTAGDITTSNDQTYGGSLDADSSPLTLTGTSVNLSGNIYGSGGGVTIDGAAALDDLTTSDVSALTVTGSATLDGSVTTTGGEQVYEGAAELTGDATLTAGKATFESDLDGSLGELPSLAITGAAEFDDPVGSLYQLSSIDVTGTTLFADDSTGASTTGNQTYQGAATIDAPSSTEALELSGTTVRFDSDVEGPDPLSVDPSNEAVFDGDVGDSTALPSLEVSGNTGVGADITTTGDQTFTGDVTLTNSVSFASGAVIDFQGPIVGNELLTMTGSGTMQLESATSDFNGLDIDAGTVEFVNGGLGYGMVTLDGGTLSWSGSNQSDVSTQGLQVLSGGGTLEIEGSDDVTLGDAVSGTGALTKTGGGTLTLPAVDDAGYGGSLTVGAGTVDVTGQISTPITVDSNGTLDVSGSLDAIATVQSDGVLNCSDGSLNKGVSNDGGTLSGAPAVPTAVTASDEYGIVDVAFTAGAANCNPVTYSANQVGGSAVETGYSPLAFSGLALGQSYRFDVTATNPVGSATSAETSPLLLPAAPTVTISSPSQNATYTEGQLVDAAFACTEASGGPGIASCTGSAADGSPIDTSGLGEHSFEVVAISEDGERATQTYSYDVVAAAAAQPPSQPAPSTGGFKLVAVTPSVSGALKLTLQLPSSGTLKLTESVPGETTKLTLHESHSGDVRIGVRANRKLAARIKRKHLKSVQLVLSYAAKGGAVTRISRTIKL